MDDPTETRGTARPVVRHGAPILHRPCAPVEAYDAALAALVDDMFASMYAARGVVLAANQIDVDARVFVYDCPDESETRHVGHVVNPTLHVSRRTDIVVEDEGCLSVPGRHAEVARAEVARVTGFDVTGAPLDLTGDGLLARCFQHECDHLDGMLYVDRIPERERRRVLAPDPEEPAAGRAAPADAGPADAAPDDAADAER